MDADKLLHRIELMLQIAVDDAVAGMTVRIDSLSTQISDVEALLHELLEDDAAE